MSLFRCDSCGCIENTSSSGYWSMICPPDGSEAKTPLCSECNPKIDKWHGEWDKESADGMMLGEDGFLYGKEHKPHHTKILGEIKTSAESPNMETKGLMPHSNTLGGGYPMSRDWGLLNFVCKRSNCVCNSGNKCFVPSRAVIGENGHCEGYHPKGYIKTEDERSA